MKQIRDLRKILWGLPEAADSRSRESAKATTVKSMSVDTGSTYT